MTENNIKRINDFDVERKVEIDRVIINMIKNPLYPCPLCGKIIIYNKRTKRHRCLNCMVFFDKHTMELIVHKAKMRLRWMELCV